ncbi:outer membrane protein assembly factor BamC [Avibacterium paragallinarum]|uniref:outer membrane protein assembly factor BamC n=1 Tax=Avibacterium paragallinarum TaxID=728 RepID=UPI003987190E
MKKWLLCTPILMVLTACSTSNESKQQANDNFEKYAEQQVFFSPLASGGVNLPKQDSTYALPNFKKQAYEIVDIRPPSMPMALIHHSVAQFDGEHSLIVYPVSKEAIYNLNQVARLLKEQGISFQSASNRIETDWTLTGRADDIGDLQIRYLIEQVQYQGASALVVSILQMKRDNIIFTPTVAQKQRYTSDRLNQLIGELNAAYRKQQSELNSTVVTPIQTQLTTDINGRAALALNAPFNQAWQRLRGALNQVGFETTSENPGRGYRELKYSPLEKTEWARFGVAAAELEKGEYAMQLSDLGRQSAVVITDEDGNALSGNQAQSIYQALQAILAK